MADYLADNAADNLTDGLARQGFGLTLNGHGIGRGRFGSPRPTLGQMDRRLRSPWADDVLRCDMHLAANAASKVLRRSLRAERVSKSTPGLVAAIHAAFISLNVG